MDSSNCGGRPCRTPDLPWRRIDGRVVVIHPRSGQVHELNPVGAQLWEAADGQRALTEIAHELAREFEVSEEQAGRDAAEFYAELERLGLVRFS
ncbi:MAG: HPr-rel-A system PqqD family peptide chaperone [Oligoflexia bacterium]|nr:HPr-rel-A system PqqD family peptide chaperone [Oligoflexia bacterium]